VNLCCGKEEIYQKYSWIKTEKKLKCYTNGKMQIVWWNDLMKSNAPNVFDKMLWLTKAINLWICNAMLLKSN